MESAVIVESVVSLFIMILVGLYAAKRGIITEQLNKGLINILINITLPLMILSSFIFTFDDSVKSNVIQVFYYSLAAYLIMGMLSYLLLQPIKGTKKTVLHFANIFTNTGYVGFPILRSVYGAEGVVYGSVFNMFFVIFVWTYGITWYRGTFKRNNLKLEFKKTLMNPSILAVCVGIIIMIFELQLPTALLSSIQSIGNITGPLSMIIIGVILSQVKLKKYITDWTIYYGIITKLIIIPLVIYLISLLFGGTSKVINTVIIMTAMPASTMTSILAERFDKEKDYAVVIVALTTLLSLISVTILLRLIS